MLTVVAPALITASTIRHRNSISLRVPSSADHSTSSMWLRARVTLAIEVSTTCSGVMFSLTRMCSGEVAITVWTRPRLANFTASAQRSMSFGCARDRPAMTAFLERHGGARALFAVAQGGVEYDDAVLVGLLR